MEMTLNLRLDINKVYSDLYIKNTNMDSIIIQDCNGDLNNFVHFMLYDMFCHSI